VTHTLLKKQILDVVHNKVKGSVKIILIMFKGKSAVDLILMAFILLIA